MLRTHNCNCFCRKCLNSNTCQNMLIKHEEKCEQKQEITTITTSDESYSYWKNHFHKNPLYFLIIVDFEADNEFYNSNIGNKTTIICKQNPGLNGYYIVSELDILKSGY